MITSNRPAQQRGRYLPRRLRPDNDAIVATILTTRTMIDMDEVDTIAWLVLACRGGPIRDPRTTTVPPREAALLEHLETTYYQARTSRPRPRGFVSR